MSNPPLELSCFGFVRAHKELVKPCLRDESRIPGTAPHQTSVELFILVQKPCSMRTVPAAYSQFKLDFRNQYLTIWFIAADPLAATLFAD